MEREIKISEGLKTYLDKKNQTEESLEGLEKEIKELMRVDIKKRDWRIMTEEEFKKHHQENINNERCSLIIANKTGHRKTVFLFAEGTEL